MTLIQVLRWLKKYTLSGGTTRHLICGQVTHIPHILFTICKFYQRVVTCLFSIGFNLGYFIWMRVGCSLALQINAPPRNNILVFTGAIVMHFFVFGLLNFQFLPQLLRAPPPFMLGAGVHVFFILYRISMFFIKKFAQFRNCFSKTPWRRAISLIYF